MNLPDPTDPTPLAPLTPHAALPEPELLLFTYGTLMLTTGIPDVDAVLRDAGTSLGRGWIRGRLFDLGQYPGAIAAVPETHPAPGAEAKAAGTGASDPASEAERAESGGADENAPRIWGRLLHLKDAAGFYAVIDRYEGFDAADLSGSEFVRARTRVYLPGMEEGILSQVYWYNLPVLGRPEIASGDYLAYWKSRGRPAQGRIES